MIRWEVVVGYQPPRCACPLHSRERIPDIRHCQSASVAVHQVTRVRVLGVVDVREGFLLCKMQIRNQFDVTDHQSALWITRGSRNRHANDSGYNTHLIALQGRRQSVNACD